MFKKTGGGSSSLLPHQIVLGAQGAIQQDVREVRALALTELVEGGDHLARDWYWWGAGEERFWTRNNKDTGGESDSVCERERERDRLTSGRSEPNVRKTTRMSTSGSLEAAATLW